MNDFILIFILLWMTLVDIMPNKMGLLQEHEPVWFPMKFIESVGLTGAEASCGFEGMGEERIVKQSQGSVLWDKNILEVVSRCEDT